MSGKLSLESVSGPRVKWEIPDFFSLSSEDGYFVESPEFQFANNPYCMRLYPNVKDRDESNVEIRIKQLRRHASLTTDVFCFGYISSNGEQHYIIQECDEDDFDDDEIRGVCENRSVFEEKRDMRVPGGTLTVFCLTSLTQSSSVGKPPSEIAKTSLVDPVLTSYEAEKQKGLPGLVQLQTDYKELLRKGAESDVCLVVSGKEFRAHRNILRARSPVFDAMFDHETAEKESGKVVIDDLDPGCFRDFLKYVYTGCLESFSDEIGLYVIADKYDVPTLKSECVKHMRRNLSVDSFCDVITVALRYSEKDLKELAIDFFKKNLARIIVTVKWQLFMNENSTSANELFIKALVPGE